MARRSTSDNMLEKLHEQHAQDKHNDRLATGSFPKVIRGRRPDLNGTKPGLTQHLLSSVLIAIMCALLGFAYMSQINNTKSAYETLDESELVHLINQSDTQIANLEQTKSQLTNQLNSLKTSADEQEQARKIAEHNEETSGLISGRLPATGEGITVRIGRGSKDKIDASIMFNLIEELRNAGAEVISLNEVRVVTRTYIQDTDSGLIADGTAIDAPYMIRAIGNSQELTNAVDIAGGVGAQLRVRYGADVNIEASDSIVIDQTREAAKYNYARTVE